jgi:hypothetical protein
MRTIILTLLFIMMVLYFGYLGSISFAQTSTEGAKKVTTSGDTLDVKLEPTPNQGSRNQVQSKLFEERYRKCATTYRL